MQVVGATDADSTDPDNTHPVPDTENDTPPVPEPPDADSETEFDAEVERTVLVIERAACGAWLNVNATGLLDAAANTPLASFAAVTVHVAGATDVDSVDPDTTQPDPVTVNDTPPVPEPPAAASATATSPRTAVIAFDTDSADCAACVNVNSAGTLVACPNTPLAAFTAVTVHVAGATDVDSVDPDTTQPDPVTVNDTPPVPEPPAAA
ncbi:MAG: hypothetical protein KGN78_14210, partial [Actinomycetales bacterium]|nr:hypothetical protein [Actinomycetales bacterium]